MSFMKCFTVPTLWVAAFTVGCGSQTDVNSWKISSLVITDGAEIPLDYTCSDREVAVATNNPELNWTEGPVGTQSYALDAAKLTLPPKEADFGNYTHTLTKMLDQVAIGKVQLNAVSSAVSGAATVTVGMKTLVFPEGTVPAP